MKQKLTPIKARTFSQICNLERATSYYGDFYLSLDEGSVYLVSQKLGEKPTGSVNIPRRAFNSLIKWYLTGKQIKRKVK